MSNSGWRTHEALRLATGFGYLGFGEPVRLSDGDRDRHDPGGDRALIDRLIDGAWHATGRRVQGEGKPPSKPKPIPSDWWEFLILEVDTDSASGGGIKFVGLRFFSGAPEPPPRKSPSLKPVSRSDLEKFMEERIGTLIASNEKSTARDDENAARAQFTGCTINRHWIAEIRAAKAPQEWRTRGRKNKTRN